MSALRSHSGAPPGFRDKIARHNHILRWKLLESVKKQEKHIPTLSGEHWTLGEAKAASE